jgi:hypothetical protein
MATPINAPMAGEIWHLSIEDLFQPVQEAPRLGGDGPFVINLSVSTAPISVPTKAFTNSPLEALVYQIQVSEDGRTRYRLRLGPFASEDEADAILAEVRDTYPGALTATASTSDLRVIASMQAKADHRPTAPRPADLVLDKSVSQKIAAERSAPEKATAPKKAAVAQRTSSLKAEVPEISIDIAWPTPELGVPPSAPLRAAPPPPPRAAIKREPPPVAVAVAPPVAVAVTPLVAIPVASKPQWTLPELDVPLPSIQKQPAAPVAPVAKETAAPVPAPKPFELKLAPPFSIASVAPVLTEVVMPTKAHAPKNASPKPAVVPAPVLTDAVVPKTKAPPSQPPAPPAAASPAVAAPAIAAAAPAPIKAPPKLETAPPLKLEIAPPLKQEAAPPPKKAIAPPPKQTMPPPPKPASPKSAALPEAVKPAPVLTQSVAPARKSWPRFRAALSKPLANKLTSLQHVVVATAPAPAPREVKKLDEPLESLESTQTIRALTPMELEDNEASRWFVIQLALADHAFDPDAVPNLDIFSEYRLYSVAGLDQGRVVHALRLGFFREEIGAVAVASYLAAYWDKPTIKRVSLAERERFADQRVEARKDVGATGKHAVIEITDELVARRRRSTKASAKNSNRSIEH